MTVMESPFTRDELAQTCDAEALAAQAEHESSLRRAANAVWHFAKRFVSFLPSEAPDFMSEHGRDHAEKRNDLNPRFDDPRG